MKPHPTLLRWSLPFAALGCLVAWRTLRTPRSTVAAPAVAAPAGSHAASGAAAARAARRCRFERGERLSYEVSVAVDIARSAGTEHFGFEGRLNLQVLRADGERAAIAAGFSPARVERDDPHRTDFERAASGPMRLEVDRRCRFTRIGVANGSDPSSAQFVRSVLLSFEVVLAEDATAPAWEASQREASGTYDARYRVAGDDPDHHDAAIVRQRVRYHLAAGPDAGAPSRDAIGIVASHARFRLAGSQPWIQDFDAREQLRLQVFEAIDITTTSHLRAIAATGFEGWPDDSIVADRFSYDESAPAPVARPVEPGPGPVNTALAGLPMAAALERYRALLAHGQSGVGRAAHFLADYFRARPAAIGEALAMLRGRRLTSDEAAPVFLALQLTRTEDARQALITVMRDPEAASIDRARASIALSDAEAVVSRSTVDSLVRVSEASRGGESAVAAAESALRALGNAGRRAAGSDPALAAEVTQRLMREVERAEGDPARRAAAVDGLGNTHDAAGMPVVAPLLDSANVGVRYAAVQAIHAIGEERAVPPLVQRFGVEPASGIRTNIAQALAGEPGQTPAAGAIELAIRALPGEQDRNVRAALIMLLGAAGATHAAAHRALVEDFPRERDVEMQRLVGRYLSAEEMS